MNICEWPSESLIPRLERYCDCYSAAWVIWHPCHSLWPWTVCISSRLNLWSRISIRCRCYIPLLFIAACVVVIVRLIVQTGKLAGRVARIHTIQNDGNPRHSQPRPPCRPACFCPLSCHELIYLWKCLWLFSVCLFPWNCILYGKLRRDVFLNF